jgi:hypothetical protein
MKTSNAKLPPAGHHVMIQCVGYRGLAYRNEGGQWKTVASNKNLPQDVEILPFRSTLR